MRQRKNPFDQPAPGFGFAGKALGGAPLGDVEWLAWFAVYSGRCGKQCLAIEAFSHGIGGIPFLRFIPRHSDAPYLRANAAQFGDYRFGVFGSRRIVVGPDGVS